MTKNLLLSILYFLGSIIIINIFITIFNYFNILNDSIIRILKFLMVILSISITSYILGKKSSKKGFLEGLKLGSITSVVFLTLALITKTFKYQSFIYYTIIILISILGSTLGINKKNT